jgi:two-component system NarL family response regulator
MDRPIGVFIINDHHLITQAMVALLKSRPEIRVIGWATDVGSISMSGVESMDVVLVNASLESADPSRAIEALKQEFPQAKIIIIGVAPDDESVLRLIEAGASGYIFKESSFDEMLDIIRTVQNGGFSCSPQMAARAFARIAELARERNGSDAARPALLTRRETDILNLIAAGLGNKEIAQHLSIAISTVKHHVHNIFDKLQVSHRRQAIRLALQKGIIRDLLAGQALESSAQNGARKSAYMSAGLTCFWLAGLLWTLF